MTSILAVQHRLAFGLDHTWSAMLLTIIHTGRHVDTLSTVAPSTIYPDAQTSKTLELPWH